MQLLEQYAVSDLPVLEKQLSKLYVNSKSKADLGSVQIMTIHKAKGLEFEHVFLPGLEKSSRPDDTKLMLWQELPHSN